MPCPNSCSTTPQNQNNSLVAPCRALGRCTTFLVPPVLNHPQTPPRLDCSGLGMVQHHVNVTMFCDHPFGLHNAILVELYWVRGTTAQCEHYILEHSIVLTCTRTKSMGSAHGNTHICVLCDATIPIVNHQLSYQRTLKLYQPSQPFSAATPKLRKLIGRQRLRTQGHRWHF